MSSFTVGNYVEVARRMQPGANEEGGVAENYRSLLSTAGSISILSSLRNRQSRDIDDSILKTWVSPEGRPIPMRSTHSAQQGYVIDVSFSFSN